jgi:hypothetical protein
MTRATFHARTVYRSPELQRIVDVLRDAAGPLSALEIMLRIKERYEKDALNVSTGIGEIRANPDFSVLTIKPKKRTEQYRYALLRAPGWRPTWQADSIVSVREDIRQQTDRHQTEEEEPEEHDRPPRLCKLDGCMTEIPESGPPFCCQDHREQWKVTTCPGSEA